MEPRLIVTAAISLVAVVLDEDALQWAVHLVVRFEHPAPRPLTIGAGRHCSFGLMAGLND